MRKFYLCKASQFIKTIKFISINNLFFLLNFGFNFCPSFVSSISQPHSFIFLLKRSDFTQSFLFLASCLSFKRSLTFELMGYESFFTNLKIELKTQTKFQADFKSFSSTFLYQKFFLFFHPF